MTPAWAVNKEEQQTAAAGQSAGSKRIGGWYCMEHDARVAQHRCACVCVCVCLTVSVWSVRFCLSQSSGGTRLDSTRLNSTSGVVHSGTRSMRNDREGRGGTAQERVVRRRRECDGCVAVCACALFWIVLSAVCPLFFLFRSFSFVFFPSSMRTWRRWIGLS